MKKFVSSILIIISICFKSEAQDVDSNLVYEQFELNNYRIFIPSGNQDTLWQIGGPNKLNGFDSAFSGKRVIITDTLNFYPKNHTSCFYIKMESLPDFWAGMCRIMELTFYHKLNCDSLSEGAYIEISYDSINLYQYNI